ncbi:probable oligoribonuclease isoform X1 [Schistocerca piceifrons]|nr:probable oligoribonuclease isoform X1 [Schistocerca piceifrons]
MHCRRLYNAAFQPVLQYFGRSRIKPSHLPSATAAFYQTSPQRMCERLKMPGDYLVWMDMEMTGLDPIKDHILEVSCIVTNADLNVVQEGPNLIIHQPDEILGNMNEWCIKNHGKTGLTEASRKSTITIQDAQNSLLSFLKENVPQGKCPVAGNTIYMDRLFLQYHMPEVNNYLHYRNVDVSSLKELCRRWYPNEFRAMPKKQLKHRALDDIRESIEELKYYRDTIFKK